MTTFDHAKTLWAIEKLRSEWPIEITDVQFDMCHERGCSTCDYGSETYVDISIFYNDIEAKAQKKQHRRVKSLKVDNFSALLQELFEVTE